MLNVHVKLALPRSMCCLPLQEIHSLPGADDSFQTGGVSSFSLSGTIAHALATFEHGRPVTGSVRLVSTSKTCLRPFVPFLGQRLRSSTEDMVWEQAFRPHELAFLRCHRVQRVSCMPGTCYTEMARAMTCDLLGDVPFVLNNVRFISILWLDDTDFCGTPTVRMQLERMRVFTILSRSNQIAALLCTTSARRLSRMHEAIRCRIPHATDDHDPTPEQVGNSCLRRARNPRLESQRAALLCPARPGSHTATVPGACLGDRLLQWHVQRLQEN